MSEKEMADAEENLSEDVIEGEGEEEVKPKKGKKGTNNSDCVGDINCSRWCWCIFYDQEEAKARAGRIA